MMRSLLLCAFALGACGGDDLSDPDGPDPICSPPGPLAAHWIYGSFEVDVDLRMATEETAESCTTSARLEVDKLTAGPRLHELHATDCSLLRMTPEGDIVMHESPTGHCWRDEHLKVSGGEHLIWLGPADIDLDGEVVECWFVLTEPPCLDAPECKCAELQRRTRFGTLSLPLARECD